MVEPDLVRAGDAYAATYTYNLDQPGHGTITRKVGPIAIPSKAAASSAYVSYSLHRAAMAEDVQTLRWANDVTSASDQSSTPPKFAPLTPADFPPPDIPPPVDGSQAYADDIPEWEVRMPVSLTPGTWHQDYGPPDQPGGPPKPLGAWQCQGFDVAWTGTPPILTRGAPAAPDSLAIPDGPRRMADEVWQHWRAGAIATLPAQGGTTYVGLPTCAWIDGTGRPDHEVNLSSKSEVAGHALRGAVTISEYINVRVTPEPVQWNFDDPQGKASGFESGRGKKPASPPQYDAVSQTWPNPQNSCPVFHQYSSVRDQMRISATQLFDFSITGYFNNGAGRTELTPITYRRQAQWQGASMPVYQIEAIPYLPAG